MRLRRIQVCVQSPRHPVTLRIAGSVRRTSTAAKAGAKGISDSRAVDLGRAIQDEFAAIRDIYRTPKHPIVLAHGLLGFDELHLGGELLPGVHYWRGITEAFAANGIEVITASVPPSGSIEERAAELRSDIAAKAQGRKVNIVAHSMGYVSGLDARYMISQMQPRDVDVLSLTTIASPHRGSAFADFCFEQIGEDEQLPKVYRALKYFGMDTGAFRQLTREYMRTEFNPKTPDADGVRYFSYGAVTEPSIMSVFRQSHRIIEDEEGPNDGLVSVASSKWGGESGYKGSLIGVNHLDLINWTNRVRWYLWELTGNKRKFNAIAFYLHIADMLAQEGY